MRLWHKDLIQVLPKQQLLGQWREVCAIARNIAVNGTPNHVLVNKVLDYGPEHLSAYANMVYEEMKKRKYRADWKRFSKGAIHLMINSDAVFKDWHNDRYLRQCLYNLQEKADCGAVPEEEWERITDKWPWFE